MAELTSRKGKFRAAIAAFIEMKKQEKLGGKSDDVEELAKFEYDRWLLLAAKETSQIQLTTHPLKATYPDAKITETTSPFVQGYELPERIEIGSHLIRHKVLDVTGNSAQLPRFKFLVETVVEDKPLLEWLLHDDSDFIAALHDDPVTAQDLAQQFKAILRTSQPPASHNGAKQIYWLTGEDACDNDQYQLLQPMFSSSLAHAAHADIQDARFGDANKAARKALRDKAPRDDVYRNYRGLVVRKLGGTKPQNISQLNSERGGVNYLLSSVPPKWQADDKRRFVVTQSALDQLYKHYPLVSLTRQLARFLRTDPPANDATRSTRRQMEQELGAQLAVFAAEVRERMTPGWTRDSDCVLPLCEQLWLDPERAGLPVRDDSEHPEYAEQDIAFNKAYTFGDWPDEVAGRFANWVNDRLGKAGVSGLGDAEYRHWAKQAIIDAAWPMPRQRRAPEGVTA